MFRMIRAAGFATASIVAILGALYADPSRALETQATPATASYLDHMTATVAAGDLSLNGLDTASDPAPVKPAHLTQHESPVSAETAGTLDDAAPLRRSLVELVGDHSSAQTDSTEQECLAGAVYFEAKGEPLQGQLSVAEVVLNRAHSGRFPSSICGVVKQRGQFSFIRAGRFPPIARATAAWHKAVAIAHIAQAELADSPAPRALFFHARRVSPGWRGLTRVAAVGNHIFYR